MMRNALTCVRTGCTHHAFLPHTHSAILFLAPLSGFDQVLAEDATVNRLEDSVLLWKSICSNALLGKTNLILFLNKIDIFRAKLDAGIRFGQYIISYGNRPNDYDSTSACECLVLCWCAGE